MVANHTLHIMRTTERNGVLRKLFRRNKTELIDVQIGAVLKEMEDVGADSDEFPTLLGYLERLRALKEKDQRAPVTSDTVALIVGNLLGILLIIAYEQKHAMTSKGLGQIIRPK